MKKIIVNDETCIGCGACIAIDSEHFDFDSDGRSYAISNENLNSDNLSNAIESCPVAAISIEEAEESCNNECQCESKESCDNKCQCESEESCDNKCQCESEESCDNECQCSCDGCHCCE